MDVLNDVPAHFLELRTRLDDVRIAGEATMKMAPGWRVGMVTSFPSRARTVSHLAPGPVVAGGLTTMKPTGFFQPRQRQGLYITLFSMIGVRTPQTSSWLGQITVPSETRWR